MFSFRCRNITYKSDLPKASVVICFYNEHYQTLLRSVHSILDRTPENLLKEIVLVDDFSDIENLHSEIESYMKENKLDKVKLLKTQQREGLIRARMFGARHSQGDVRKYKVSFSILLTVNFKGFDILG